MSQPPPNDELRALLDAGRRAVVLVPSEARGRIEDRLGALAGWPATGAPRPTASGGSVLHGVKVATVAKAALLFVAGAGAGLATKDHVWPPAPKVETRYVDRVVEVERPVPVPASPSAPAPSSAPPSPAAPAVGTPAPARPSAENASAAIGKDEMLARERTMIETARSALARGDGSGALAILSQHAAAFPRGQLAETREALAIQALSRLGRGDEARARAARFRRDYPSSVYQTVVDEATRTISP